MAALLAAADPSSPAAGGGYGYAPLRQIGDESVVVIERLGEPIPGELRFYDSFHNDVALKDLLDGKRPVLVSLVYFECPMLCSLVMKGLVRALNDSGLQLGKDYRGVTVSFDRDHLKCFRYDPGTGRYRVYAMNFVRGGAFASFLALAVGLGVLWRQEWKRKRRGA